jgi:hypothetical protein
MDITEESSLVRLLLPEPNTPVSFNVEITPPPTCSSSNSNQPPDGATSLLPDVVPKSHRRLLKHRPSLSAQLSSSLDTDSSLAETPLFQYSAGAGTTSSTPTAFPFNTPMLETNDSATSGSGRGPDTPEPPEIRKFKKYHSRQGYPITPLDNPKAGKPALVQQLVAEQDSPISITRLPCLPERSTYPVEQKPGEILPSSKPVKHHTMHVVHQI